MTELDPWEAGVRLRYREVFISGLKCFRNEDWEGALNFFRAAAEGADFDDIYSEALHLLPRPRARTPW